MTDGIDTTSGTSTTGSGTVDKNVYTVQVGSTSEPISPPAGTTLTQDEVNKLVGSARVEARTAFLKKHGFGSEEELKAALTRAKELEESQLSELEKANKRIEELTTAAEEAKRLAEAAHLQNLRARIGREKGLPEPLIERLVATDEVSITEEVEALLPFVRTESTPPSVGGGTNPADASSMGGSPDEKMAQALLKAVRGG